MTVNKREQMTMPLDLLSLLRETILTEPALRSELVRIGTPVCDSGIHATDRDHHFFAGGDSDVVHQLASGCTEGSRERNDVVLSGL